MSCQKSRLGEPHAECSPAETLGASVCQTGEVKKKNNIHYHVVRTAEASVKAWETMFRCDRCCLRPSENKNVITEMDFNKIGGGDVGERTRNF